jgi:hypothetical protein
MAMKLNIANLFQFITYISPFLLAFMFVMLGFLNGQPVKSVVYIGAVSLATFIAMLLQTTIKSDAIVNRSPMCDLWELPFIGNAYNSPSLSTFFIAFSAVYMLLPMFMSGQMNYPIMFLFIFLLVADTISKVSNKCTNMIGVLLGFIFALVFGGVLSSIIYSTVPEIIFFSDKTSNNVTCGKPTKQNFKCSVYKNGVLVKNL